MATAFSVKNTEFDQIGLFRTETEALVFASKYINNLTISQVEIEENLKTVREWVESHTNQEELELLLSCNIPHGWARSFWEAISWIDWGTGEKFDAVKSIYDRERENHTSTINVYDKFKKFVRLA